MIFLISHTVMVKFTKAAPLFHMHQWRYQGAYHHSDLCSCPGTFQNTVTEDPVWSRGFSETDDEKMITLTVTEVNINN